MHWLQALDNRLFDFINQSLANPFFDWLMPILSGSNGVKNEFIVLAVAVGVALLCFGKLRARLCVLLLILIVATNDGLICNTIKHAVARPRPFVTLPEARVFGTVGKGYVLPEMNEYGVDTSVNKGSRTSMPSSHAGNWFAATMILFIYYRRSLWFMLPMALAVSFSRVYNGVHYPSDVLVGAILGAGYAAAGAIALQAAWRWIGKKWFPLARAIALALECRMQNAKCRNTKSKTLNPQLLGAAKRSGDGSTFNFRHAVASPRLHRDFRHAHRARALHRQRHD